MIVLILFKEVDDKSGRETGGQLVSHGVNLCTLETVILPAEEPGSLEAMYNAALCEWVLK